MLIVLRSVLKISLKLLAKVLHLSLYSSDSGTGGKINHHRAHTNLPQNFSIKIRYGSDKEGKVPYITFDEVWLQGVAHTITENGSPIYEQYSFIARDVGYSAWSR